MTFKEAIVTTLTRQYLDFNGRASMSQMWYFLLFIFIVNLALSIMMPSGPAFFGGLFTLFNLGILLPEVGVLVRRLHDIDKSGWWVLIYLIPIVGLIFLIIWGTQKGTPGPNQYGPAPLS